MTATIIHQMIGKIFVDVIQTHNELDFLADNEVTFTFFHDQDCGEDVHIDEVIGDLDDLKCSPMLQAEFVTNRTDPAPPSDTWDDESHTWTFYKFATIKGSVTVRWFGSSNGNYSETVDLYIKPRHGEGEIVRFDEEEPFVAPDFVVRYARARLDGRIAGREGRIVDADAHSYDARTIFNVRMKSSDWRLLDQIVEVLLRNPNVDDLATVLRLAGWEMPKETEE